eukprot:PLAT8828.1.p1 GENE.PLAT8828.1~~PLAT8828.1.p1  ORF type:complete len:776 (-),score=236.72 PLAT8828.1:315-2642(-)
MDSSGRAVGQSADRVPLRPASLQLNPMRQKPPGSPRRPASPASPAAVSAGRRRLSAARTPPPPRRRRRRERSLPSRLRRSPPGGTALDLSIPEADDVPTIDTTLSPVPAAVSPLVSRLVGEGGDFIDFSTVTAAAREQERPFAPRRFCGDASMSAGALTLPSSAARGASRSAELRLSDFTRTGVGSDGAGGGDAALSAGPLFRLLSSPLAASGEAGSDDEEEAEAAAVHLAAALPLTRAVSGSTRAAETAVRVAGSLRGPWSPRAPSGRRSPSFPSAAQAAAAAAAAAFDEQLCSDRKNVRRHALLLRDRGRCLARQLIVVGSGSGRSRAWHLCSRDASSVLLFARCRSALKYMMVVSQDRHDLSVRRAARSTGYLGKLEQSGKCCYAMFNNGVRSSKKAAKRRAADGSRADSGHSADAAAAAKAAADAAAAESMLSLASATSSLSSLGSATSSASSLASFSSVSTASPPLPAAGMITDGRLSMLTTLPYAAEELRCQLMAAALDRASGEVTVVLPRAALSTREELTACDLAAIARGDAALSLPVVCLRGRLMEDEGVPSIVLTSVSLSAVSSSYSSLPSPFAASAASACEEKKTGSRCGSVEEHDDDGLSAGDEHEREREREHEHEHDEEKSRMRRKRKLMLAKLRDDVRYRHHLHHDDGDDCDCDDVFITITHTPIPDSPASSPSSPAASSPPSPASSPSSSPSSPSAGGGAGWAGAGKRSPTSKRRLRSPFGRRRRQPARSQPLCAALSFHASIAPVQAFATFLAVQALLHS